MSVRCTQALAEAMARNQDRRWEALEEGALIQELCRGLGLTQARVAQMLGRDKSWVARRLALIEALPARHRRGAALWAL